MCWRLLILPFINDLLPNIQSQVRLFADDTAVHLTVTSFEDANNLEADLDNLQEYDKNRPQDTTTELQDRKILRPKCLLKYVIYLR